MDGKCLRYELKGSTPKTGIVFWDEAKLHASAIDVKTRNRLPALKC